MISKEKEEYKTNQKQMVIIYFPAIKPFILKHLKVQAILLMKL
jgi:hypothetical protein